MTQLEFKPKKKKKEKVNASLLFTYSWLGAYNFQNQTLKEVIENQ